MKVHYEIEIWSKGEHKATFIEWNTYEAARLYAEDELENNEHIDQVLIIKVTNDMIYCKAKP